MTRILLIEDNPDNAELVLKILASGGFEASHALDAETGLEMAKKIRPGLILLDLGLPDFDGQTLAGWLRADPVTAKIPLVAFTAWPEATVRPMIASYGFVGYIGKPMPRTVEFLAQIKSFIK